MKVSFNLYFFINVVLYAMSEQISSDDRAPELAGFKRNVDDTIITIPAISIVAADATTLPTPEQTATIISSTQLPSSSLRQAISTASKTSSHIIELDSSTRSGAEIHSIFSSTSSVSIPETLISTPPIIANTTTYATNSYVSSTAFPNATSEVVPQSLAPNVAVTSQVASQNISNDTSTLDKTKTAQKLPSTTIYVISGILGAGLITAIGFFIHNRKRQRRRNQIPGNTIFRGEAAKYSPGSSCETRHDDVYGGLSGNKSTSRKHLKIQRIPLIHNDSFVLTSANPFESPRRLNDTQSDFMELAQLQNGSRRISPSPQPSSNSAFANDHYDLYGDDHQGSSIYSTDIALPFRLGSPVRSKPPKSLTPRRIDSYRRASWRARGLDNIISTYRSSLRPEYKNSDSVARKSQVAIVSHFSDLSSIQGARPNHSKKLRDNDIADGKLCRGQDVSVISRPAATLVGKAAGAIQVSRNSMQRRFETIGRIQLNGSQNVVEQSPEDGRRTQVYKILKRIMGDKSEAA